MNDEILPCGCVLQNGELIPCEVAAFLSREVVQAQIDRYLNMQKDSREIRSGE